MEPLLPILGTACLILVALAVLLGVANVRRERRRQERLAAWANRNGWRVTYAPAVDWGQRLPGGDPRGVSLALSTVIEGWPVSVAEYAYTETRLTTNPDGRGGTVTSTTTQTHTFIVVVIRLPRDYPTVAVQARSAVARLGRRLFGGGTGTGMEEFERRYRVVGVERGRAGQLISPALAAEHVAGTVPPWSLFGAELLAWWPGAIERPEEIPATVGPLLRVAWHLDRVR